MRRTRACRLGSNDVDAVRVAQAQGILDVVLEGRFAVAISGRVEREREHELVVVEVGVAGASGHCAATHRVSPVQYCHAKSER